MISRALFWPQTTRIAAGRALWGVPSAQEGQYRLCDLTPMVPSVPYAQIAATVQAVGDERLINARCAL